MLTTENNELLTQVGKGTAMGELLRYYWHPIAAVGELEENPVKPVRLMGEDLVLFKSEAGTYGLLARHCPHRRADLSYGFVDKCGLRCSYHGWAFDEDGHCTHQPYEEVANSGRTTFRDSIRQPAYRAEAKAGMIFAYIGPDPAPLCPNWELFEYENGFSQVVIAEIECNWLQCAENDIDPVHFEWLHDNWSFEQAGWTGKRSPRHLRIAVEEWEYGFGYRRIKEDSDESSSFWTRPRLHLMPNIFMPGGTHFEYRVPIDDEHTLSVVWAYEAVPAEQRPFVQQSIPYWRATVVDPLSGRYLSSHVINQDTVAWMGQGVISDRENEHLGRSDIGVGMFRDQLKADLEAIKRGEDPKGVIRDPEKNVLVRWPDNRREILTSAVPREEWWERKRRANAANGLRPHDEYFQFYAGQPDAVRKAYEVAMGL